MTSVIDNDVGAFFVLELLDGRVFAIPTIHLQVASLFEDNLQLDFDTHVVTLSGIKLKELMLDLAARGGKHIRVIDPKYKDAQSENAPLVLSADITPKE